MNRTRAGRALADVALTVAALVGALGLLLVLAGAIAGVRPLLFRSGSMAPAIGTGDLALAHSVPASALRVGDVVSVLDGDGHRVTHRVARVEGTGAVRSLVLRGDANTVVDRTPYVVSHADRVVFVVHGAGRVVAAVAGPVGTFVLGLYVAGMLALVLRGPRPPRARSAPGARAARTARGAPGRRRAAGGGRRSRRRPVTAAVVLTSTAALAPVVVPSGAAEAAAWTDQVPITAAAFSTTTVLPPDSTSCTATGATATVAWPEKDPRYDYEAVLRRQSDGQAISTTQVTGSALSVSYTAPADFQILLVALGTYSYRVEIRSYPAGDRAWTSASTLISAQTIKVSVFVLNVLGDVTCV
ncbi:MAG: S24/S26 family peptidase [Marmoricola sp.]